VRLCDAPILRTNNWCDSDTGYRAVPELPPTEFDYDPKYDFPHCPAFKDIGELRGPFDLGLIPIGAYDPRFIMSPMSERTLP